MFYGNGNGGGALSGATGILWLALTVLVIAALWRLFNKAGKPGWGAIIPIYNLYLMLAIIGRPWWWLLLYLIPFVNIVIAIMVTIEFARAYGRGWPFGIGMLLLPYVFYPILAWGRYPYEGPVA